MGRFGAHISGHGLDWIGRQLLDRQVFSLLLPGIALEYVGVSSVVYLIYSTGVGLTGCKA